MRVLQKKRGKKKKKKKRKAWGAHTLLWTRSEYGVAGKGDLKDHLSYLRRIRKRRRKKKKKKRGADTRDRRIGTSSASIATEEGKT